MSGELTDKEAQALFNSTSKALRDNDDEKLSQLLDKDTPIELEPVADPLAEKPEAVTEPVVEGKEGTPPVKAEPIAEQTTPTPTELELLKQKLDKVSKENHDLRSQAGRVPAVQRRISELDKKLADLEAKSKAAPTSQTADDVKELLKGVSETDPDLADAIAAAITKATSGVNDTVTAKERETLQFQRAQEYDEYASTEVNRLLGMYPNAREVFQDPNWAAWKQGQSKGIVNLADSDNADDVSYAFQKYAADMATKYPDLAKQTTEPVKQAVVDPNVEKAEQIEAERKRKKESAVTIGSPNAAGKVDMPSDAQALFEKFSSEIRKQRLG